MSFKFINIEDNLMLVQIKVKYFIHKIIMVIILIIKVNPLLQLQVIITIIMLLHFILLIIIIIDINHIVFLLKLYR